MPLRALTPVISSYHPKIQLTDNTGKTHTITMDLPDWSPDNEIITNINDALGTQTPDEIIYKIANKQIPDQLKQLNINIV